MNVAYVGLGANKGDRVGNVQRAMAMLSEAGDVTHAAPLYETQPVHVPDVQPPYINTVVRLRTVGTAAQLWHVLQSIEHALGRVRTHRYSARTIDCDLLLFANTAISSQTLTVPHPRIMQRAFVLVPLLAIMPDAERTWAPGFLDCTIPTDEVRRWIASDSVCASKHTANCVDTRNSSLPHSVEYRSQSSER